MADFETNLPTGSVSHSVGQFPNVFFGRYQVWSLTPSETDEMLANGWFRQSGYVQTTLGRFVRGSIAPCVMLRVNLERFVFKKRLAKLLRQNSGRFTTHIGPYHPNEASQELWARFKSTVHQWQNVPVLADHILRDNQPNAFGTHQLSVMDGNKLVAFSLFDLGRTSLASLEAAYDPAYKAYSLGIFTMLVELQYGMDKGLAHYYPGFYPKGDPMFDYKLRPGNLSFFQAKTGKWLPWDHFREADWLLDEVREMLRQVREMLRGFGFEATFKYLDKYGFPTGRPSLANYNFIATGERRIGPERSLLTQTAYDPLAGEFYLFGKLENQAEQNSQVQAVELVPFGLVGSYDDLAGLESGIKTMLAYLHETLM